MIKKFTNRKSLSKDKKHNNNKTSEMNNLPEDLLFDIFKKNLITNKMKSVSKNFRNINTNFSNLILNINNQKVDKIIKNIKDINNDKKIVYTFEKYKKIDDTEIMIDKTKIYVKSIILSDINILPENFGYNLTVGGDFDISSNGLTLLPEKFGYNLTVEGNLDLSGNDLTSLPENFGYNLTIRGNLDLSDNDLTSLPENFGNIEIGGDLDLSSNQLTKKIIPKSVLTLVNDIFMKKCIYIFKKSILGLHYKINKFMKKIIIFINSDLMIYFLNNLETFSVDNLINDFFENIFYGTMVA